MAIVRTVEWRLRCSPQEADGRIRDAMTALGISPEGPPGHIAGEAKRALLKNRWAARIAIDVEPDSTVRCRIDTLGTKHFEVADDIAEQMGDVFDDRGVMAAVERLGKLGRLFGRKEVAHLRNVLRARESVVELGQGQYGTKQGLVILTNERLFFLEKSLGGETLEEFDLSAVASVGVSKQRTGETLQIRTAAAVAEISHMWHGQGDSMASAIRQLRRGPPMQTVPERQDADDPIAQLERLSNLRDKGVLSDAEFEAKKAELLDRL